MISKIRKKLSEVRKHGVSYVLKKVFSDHIYNVDHVLILSRSLQDEFPFRRVRIKNMVVSLLECSEDRARLLAQFPSHKRIFREYFDQGLQVAAASIDNEIVGYVWIATGSFYDRHLYRRVFEPDPDQVYQFSGLVKEGYRGKPVALIVMRFVNDLFAARGYKRTLAAVSASNEASMKFHTKAQYVATGKAFDLYRFLGWRWSRDAPPAQAIERFIKE